MRMVALLAAASFTSAALMLAFSRGPLSLSAFLCSVVLSVAPFPMCCHVSRTLARAGSLEVAAEAHEDQRVTEAAYTEGQQSVLALVRLARDDARAQLAALTVSLEPDVAALVTTRLQEVDRRLESLASGA